MTDDSTNKSVGSDFPNQQARLRQLLNTYRSIPDGVGAFGAEMIEATLRRADAAQASGDIVAIVRSYQEMDAYK